MNDPESRRLLMDVARDIHQQRQQCMTTSLDEAEPDGTTLSQAQRKRLGQVQLDKTLSNLHGHAAWKGGLGIASQNWPLKESLVLEDSLDECQAGVDEHFSFDAEVRFNPEVMPGQHPLCHEKYGGVCEKSEVFQEVIACVAQLDGFLAFHKMDRPGTLLRLGVGSTDDSSALNADEASRRDSRNVWCVLGAVSKKPVLHPLVILHPCTGQESAFKFSILEDALEITTSHLLCKSLLLLAHGLQAGSAEPTGVEIALDVYGPLSYKATQATSELPNRIELHGQPLASRRLGLHCEPPPRASKLTMRMPFALKLQAQILSRRGRGRGHAREQRQKPKPSNVKKLIGKSRGRGRRNRAAHQSGEAEAKSQEHELRYDASEEPRLDLLADQAEADGRKVERRWERHGQIS